MECRFAWLGSNLGAILFAKSISLNVERAPCIFLHRSLSRPFATLDVSPGAMVSLQRGASRFEPFVDVPKLASGDLSAEAWQARCEEAGIADMPLASDVNAWSAPGVPGPTTA